MICLRVLAGAEHGSRSCQGHLNPPHTGMRASEHASRGPFYVLECLDGLAKVVQCRTGVLVCRATNLSPARITADHRGLQQHGTLHLASANTQPSSRRRRAHRCSKFSNHAHHTNAAPSTARNRDTSAPRERPRPRGPRSNHETTGREDDKAPKKLLVARPQFVSTVVEPARAQVLRRLLRVWHGARVAR